MQRLSVPVGSPFLKSAKAGAGDQKSEVGGSVELTEVRSSLPEFHINKTGVGLSLRSERWKWTDFHGLNQTMRQSETMAHVLIGKDGSSQVAHDLMNIDQDAPGTLRIKGDRLHVRVDLGPLLRPVSAHFFGPADKTALERSWPSHVRGHGGEGGIDVSRVECRVGRAEQFDF